MVSPWLSLLRLRTGFRQPHLDSDAVGPDDTGSESALCHQPFELGARVGAPSEPAKDPLRDEGAQPAKALLAYFLGDVGTRRILSKVLDHGCSTGSKDAEHLINRGDRSPEVLEGGLADDHIEGLRLEGHGGHIAVPKVNAHPRLPRVLGGDLDEGLADVEPGHEKPSDPRDFDGKVTRPGRHFEHTRPVGDAGSQLHGLLPVYLDLVWCAALAVVPAGHRAFHLGQPKPAPIEAHLLLPAPNGEGWGGGGSHEATDAAASAPSATCCAWVMRPRFRAAMVPIAATRMTAMASAMVGRMASTKAWVKTRCATCWICCAICVGIPGGSETLVPVCPRPT